MWSLYYQEGVLPRKGGWLDQPLHLIVQLYAISIAKTTLEKKDKKDIDWSTDFTITQKELIKWIDK
jgi:hypothetical protein